MIERKSARYRLLELRASAKPETNGTSFGVFGLQGEPPKPRFSMIRNLAKAVLLVVVAAALTVVFFYAGEWIADHVITHDTYALAPRPTAAQPAGAQPASVPPAGQAASSPAQNAAAVPAPTTEQRAPAASQPALPVSTRPEASPAVSLAHGSIVLQVAALTRKDDAGTLAAALQKKQYPAFVRLPTTDNFYRVQVGPYPDVPSANAVKRALEHDGYQVFLRR